MLKYSWKRSIRGEEDEESMRTWRKEKSHQDRERTPSEKPQLRPGSVPAHAYYSAPVPESWFSLWPFANKTGPQRLQLQVPVAGYCSGLWCWYMKGGLPDWGPVLPIRMLISSSRSWNDGDSDFSLTGLESEGRTRDMWGSAPTPCRPHRQEIQAEHHLNVILRGRIRNVWFGRFMVWIWEIKFFLDETVWTSLFLLISLTFYFLWTLLSF